MHRKKKIIALCHLSIALAFLLWLISVPFLKEFIIKKSADHLYRTIERENGSLIPPEISHDEMRLIAETQAALQKKSIWKEVLLPERAAALPLIWLGLSLTLPLFYLVEMKGSAPLSLLLPLISLAYLMVAPKTTQTLFPSKEFIIENYVGDSGPLSKKALNEGYRNYLIDNWGKEKTGEDSEVQYKRALIHFNRSRLKALTLGHYSDDLLGIFFGPPSKITKVLLFLWNLFFACFLNLKRRESLKTSLS